MKKNPKFEYRNPKQIQMTKIQMTKKKKFQITNPKLQTNSKLQITMTKTKPQLSEHHTFFVLNFEHLDFGFVSDFGFRASDLFKTGGKYGTNRSFNKRHVP
ncbi:MAG: hypothetical protein GTO45_41045 [Candidatus Aminicenantes bacterium]|nr:hypothetical protein [Candidatus Aminicenantes bacterium]NIM84992.1 hypothetical protein [Candidatus Aminicenantes bacterium]NIN24506.1 hypothetical protein [Candidatus Aminicenantes bacterium]NIN48270.1 hypothetical protein [Candidatus Aminicenantes bacterium]NIN91173.1 hypothetical protein [Candidatus Aminicenantes bacterium]